MIPEGVNENKKKYFRKQNQGMCVYMHTLTIHNRKKEWLRTLFPEIAICLPDYKVEVKISFMKLLKSITIETKTPYFFKAYLSTHKQFCLEFIYFNEYHCTSTFNSII